MLAIERKALEQWKAIPMSAKDDAAVELYTHIQGASEGVRKAQMLPQARATVLRDLAKAYAYVASGGVRPGDLDE